ncbi:Ig-like domain-containing protein [Bacillus sp. 165]|uniref:Ig-like domain-containing protein n=1 Tax=Bacillus sp. 165 TaxID=1529117 RepID=UPI001ADCE806|nr:Ig-like domain-containing protein [Bacillus sp. 165]MBO9128617.1 Ig domain-containing protein [Bacillus sp. 165]
MIRKHKEHVWNTALSSHTALFIDPLLEKTKIRKPLTPVPVNVISIHVNKPKLKMKIGQAESITFSIIPVNATNKKVHWVVSNPDVVHLEIENGKAAVKGKRAGRTIIVVTTEDGKYRDLCEITVHNFLNGR